MSWSQNKLIVLPIINQLNVHHIDCSDNEQTISTGHHLSQFQHDIGITFQDTIFPYLLIDLHGSALILTMINIQVSITCIRM